MPAGLAVADGVACVPPAVADADGLAVAVALAGAVPLTVAVDVAAAVTLDVAVAVALPAVALGVVTAGRGRRAPGGGYCAGAGPG
ncbi:MAG TPA: hypothetical protein VNM16_12545, partial [Bacillota bacterium]|nr:hypothetical protein [Bacillota bacterium]